MGQPGSIHSPARLQLGTRGSAAVFEQTGGFPGVTQEKQIIDAQQAEFPAAIALRPAAKAFARLIQGRLKIARAQGLIGFQVSWFRIAGARGTATT